MTDPTIKHYEIIVSFSSFQSKLAKIIFAKAGGSVSLKGLSFIG